MKQALITLAMLFFGTAGLGMAQAQEGPISAGFHIGVFTPALPLVAIGGGQHPNVMLGGAPAIGLELEYQWRTRLAFYADVSSVFTRLYHSGVMELQGVDGAHSSRATLLSPTAGVLFTPRVGTLALQPTLRAGLGTKLYHFDLQDADGPVADLTGDVGLGFAVNSGALRFVAEARWMPSRFEANHLPIRAYGNLRQMQNDWTFQMGFRVRP
jgi:hypothetical protein